MIRVLTGEARVLLVLKRASMSFSELIEATGMSSSHLNYTLNKLMALGLIAKRGRYYVLTDRGRAELEAVVSLLAEFVG